MRILQVIPYFAPAWAYGGPARVVLDMSRWLVQRGHGVVVCTSDALDAHRRHREARENIDGVEVFRFPNLSNYLAWRAKLFTPFGARSFLRAEVGRFDLVHIGDFRTLMTVWASRVAQRAGVPYLLSAYGQLPRAGALFKAAKVLFDALYGREALAKAARVIAQTEHEALQYAHWGVPREKVALLPLGVDLKEFDSLPPRGLLRRELGLKEGERVILFLGRISRHKGLELLLGAFSRLCRDVREARLVIVGRDDGYLGKLTQLIGRLHLPERVYVLGPRYGEARLPCYVDADLFVLSPTHFEETPLAALEACAAGTPVVVTAQASIPWLEEYGAGRVVQHDEEALAEALEGMLTSPERLAESGRAARRLVEERFSWDVLAAALEGFYRDALSEGKGSAQVGLPCTS